MVLAGSGGTVVGTAASGAYSLLLALETAGHISAVGYAGAEPRVFGGHGAADATQVGLYVIMFVGVGVFAGAAGRILHERVTALELANRRLARARLDTTFVLTQLGSGLLSLDEDGRILHFNRAAGEILGFDPATVIGQPLAALGPGAQRFIAWIEEARHGSAPLMRQSVEITTPSGQELPIGMSGSRVGHAGLIVVFQDLTLARREEADRARKEKLAAIGGLVGGITHEIRNGIRPIAGSLDVLKQEPAIVGQNRRLLEIAVRECNRVGRFIQALLDYGRVTPLVLEPVDLKALVVEVEELVRIEAGKVRVQVQVDPAAEGLEGLIDREQMKQVLLNLAQNALEAMAPAGGDLQFTLSREPLPAATGGQAAVIRVIDSGPGIPAEIAARIFEPFFTTKPGGTGFGLAIAAGIVERHGGSLEVRPDLARRGATFEIRLPERASFEHPDLAAPLAASA
jgi:PAS domain S-box-containing protein